MKTCNASRYFHERGHCDARGGAEKMDFYYYISPDQFAGAWQCPMPQFPRQLDCQKRNK